MGADEAHILTIQDPYDEVHAPLNSIWVHEHPSPTFN